MQTTNTVFMVRPIRFAYNEQTAINNEFQINELNDNVQSKTLKEFNAYVDLLKENDINVVVANDTENPNTPDSIFPNNWFSTHENGVLVLYPMYAENRRNERKSIFVNTIKNCVNVKKIIDLTIYEKDNKFLEGTGSMVLDRDNKIIYACKSIRTSTELLDILAKRIEYQVCCFDAISRNGLPIYHTNVMMAVCKDFAVVCLETIKDEEEKTKVINSLKSTNKLIIDISYEQLEHFAGNILELRNNNNERILVMSDCAKSSYTNQQLDILSSKGKIIAPDITTIETNGGGSARCMLAEIY